MPEIVLYLVISAGLIVLSRRSLPYASSHGFTRFFAWQCLLVLLLLNVRRWFDAPFSPHQLASWLLLFGSLALVVPGVKMLRERGKAAKSREEATLLGFERTTVLVTDGIYHYVRHPLYGSLIVLGWGIFFKDPSWIGGLLASATTGLMVATARMEEAENRRYFGRAYDDYMKRTRMFVPFVV